MIIFGIIFCWALCQVDFVMAYLQAPIKMDIYMELPQGIQTAHENSKDHMLKLEKNIYSQKQAGCVWNSFLVNKLLSIGFTAPLIDDCMFFRDDIIFMVYVDNCIFLGNDDSKLQEAIKDIQDLGLNIEDQGHPADYVGVNIKKLQDGLYEFTQRALIDSIINGIIPVMNLLQEMRERDYQVICTKPHMYCKVFEDNSDALELARLPKLHPRTKHINVCYHHFCEHVQKGLI
jgi:hypothetical protein